ncbi:MAG TPA: carboxypeptidase regulatory-like domain-containing protein [Gemmatimonadaceae bacterium]|jgi:hypothetical protein
MPVGRSGWWLALAAAGPLAAQVPVAAPRGAVYGVVYDSVAARPLAGAAVQLAAAGATQAPHSTQTDSAGRYRIIGLAPGQYTLGFYHDALTALGLDAPTRGIALDADAEVMADLAVPSSRTIRTLRCGDEDAESSSGMLVGYARDARQQHAVAGTAVRLSWKAFALDSGSYRTVTERATASIEDDGAFLVCHLPIDAPLELDVTSPGHHRIIGSVTPIPPSGIGRLEIALADSAESHGDAIIRGRVARVNGKAVESGRVVVPALGREAAIARGEFTLGDLPPGSWVVEARAIGSEPQSLLVNAPEGASAMPTIALRSQVQALEAVTVVGKKDANLRLLDEVLRRKRIGMGTTFLPGAPALRSAILTSDVMREARGFVYSGQSKIIGRAGCQFTAVYVDDVLQAGGFADADMLAPPSEVLAIETWPDILLAPVQYRIAKGVNAPAVRGSLSGSYCAVVLIWTKNRPRG